MSEQTEHILEAPLVVYRGRAGIGVLPAGTVLRFVRGFPEGFDRYCVFVNVEGPSLQRRGASPPDSTRPLTAFRDRDASEAALNPDEIGGLLRSLGATRSEIEAILEDWPSEDR